MRHALPVLVVLTAAMVTAQAPSATATIEVVSIKRDTSGTNGGDFGPRTGGYAAEPATVADCLAERMRLQAHTETADGGLT